VTTTLFTPIIAPSPTVTPFKINAFWPIQAYRHTFTGLISLGRIAARLEEPFEPGQAEILG
jgi:hypothetical protein